MFKLSYNANGLRNLSLNEAIQAVAAAGYDGIELSLHPNHIDPNDFTRAQASAVQLVLADLAIEACCLATGADQLLGPERFEPSLIHTTKAGRRRRIDLIRRALDIAAELGVPVVNFASGIRKPEMTPAEADELLVTGITECLKDSNEAVILAIEPEPGFFIESNGQGVDLINRIGSPRLALSQDIGHENVVEDDYLDSIDRALPVTRHIQVEDIKARHHRHEIPGEGDIDFRSFFAALHRRGYRHHLSVELYNHADVYPEALRRSLAFLRHKAAEVTGELADVSAF